ncbi:hypothetical protein NDU88_003331 [Pleurodeles waltl]|uniref:Uncharacterized protein n=1 Tax=Pleurodeles waltl TaxID=8319 RepID=A0AAV7SFN1_PLEWA|nr:hypothetical protein NDU88_003331 [Pleurodeles waltl]
MTVGNARCQDAYFDRAVTFRFCFLVVAVPKGQGSQKRDMGRREESMPWEQGIKQKSQELEPGVRLKSQEGNGNRAGNRRSRRTFSRHVAENVNAFTNVI